MTGVVKAVGYLMGRMVFDACDNAFAIVYLASSNNKAMSQRFKTSDVSTVARA